MTRLYHWPPPETLERSNGVGRVGLALAQHLPRYGIEFVSDPHSAEVFACHTQRGKAPRVDLFFCHGFYFSDLDHAPYGSWQMGANRGIVEAARQARVITVPSDWIAEAFRRDMRLQPEVIPHGVEADEWAPGDNGGYLLWNKNRGDQDVCDPLPAWLMAAQGAKVVSTFAPRQPPGPAPAGLEVIGSQPFERMREIVQAADVYLATTRETFGIGTLEAMASGVPVLGYRWGATPDLVRHGVEGYLVEPGDIDGLVEGLAAIRASRPAFSEAARARARLFTWDAAAAAYARLIQEIAHTPEPDGVAVVIPCYNYGRYVGGAIKSVLYQSRTPDEVIVVDDGSTDETPQVLEHFRSEPRVRILRQENAGVAAARNRGIASTRQPFIVCLDADDQLDSIYLQTCAEALRKDRQLGVAYTGLTILSDRPMLRQPSSWPPVFDWQVQSRVEVPPATCIPSAAMFRRAMWERAGGYRQEYAPGEDAEFWTRGLSVGFTARRITPAGLFLYRVHRDNAHRRLQYRPIDRLLPWMRDQQYPMAAPAANQPEMRSYAEPAVTMLLGLNGQSVQDLPEALDLLLAQTCRSWEVVVSGPHPPDDLLARFPFARCVPKTKAAAAAARAPLIWRLSVREALRLEPDAVYTVLERLAASEGRELGPLEVATMGCCGGSAGAQAVIRARRALTGGQDTMGDNFDAKSVTGPVRMRFTGERTGTVSYHGQGGRVYRGSASPARRFADVHPEDVTILLRTGVWAVVERAPAPAPAPRPAVQKAQGAPEATPKGAGEPEPASVPERAAGAGLDAAGSAPASPKPRRKAAAKTGGNASAGRGRGRARSAA